MKIRMYLKSLKTQQICEDHELTVGKYNEFYLPAIGPGWEAWIVITDEDDEVTRLHLKR